MFCETCRMVLRRCGAKVLSWNVSGDVFVADFDAQNGIVETGNDRLFPCGRVDPKAKKDGRHERPNARESFAHGGDKHVDERKHRT